jgi:C-terminal processing protease CtpA/Prc
VGLKKDDVIISVNDIDFSNIKVNQAISYIKTQNKIKLKVKRNNMMTVSILTNDIDIDLRKFDEENELYLKKCLIIRSNLKQSFGFTVNVLIKPDIINILFVTK